MSGGSKRCAVWACYERTYAHDCSGALFVVCVAGEDAGEKLCRMLRPKWDGRRVGLVTHVEEYGDDDIRGFALQRNSAGYPHNELVSDARRLANDSGVELIEAPLGDAQAGLRGRGLLKEEQPGESAPPKGSTPKGPTEATADLEPADPIPLTWLREQVPKNKVRGDASKLALWLTRRNVPVFKVAGKNYAERRELLRTFKAGSRVHELITEYTDDGK